ncbi:hypothetical protein [Parabacteroides sp. PF5-9]|nr:hypothetical protein [Parabacteroides sp. PF5-9]MDH6357983.1 hypothetical protein [Parabacteroides sp. PF5-9]
MGPDQRLALKSGAILRLFIGSRKRSLKKFSDSYGAKQALYLVFFIALS